MYSQVSTLLMFGQRNRWRAAESSMRAGLQRLLEKEQTKKKKEKVGIALTSESRVEDKGFFIVLTWPPDTVKRK